MSAPTLAWSDPKSADAFCAETGAMPRWANERGEVTLSFKEEPEYALLALVLPDGRKILQGDPLLAPTG
jgi:hypothetical protein